MNHISNTLIPERLKSAREQQNLSKAEAARRIGLTSASYVRYEAGDRSPSPQVLMSIAEKLDTSVAFLSGETDDISPDLIIIHKKED
nr:helix-turn-helix domain-containing protein [Lachnospiraceae bacterium]